MLWKWCSLNLFFENESICIIQSNLQKHTFKCVNWIEQCLERVFFSTFRCILIKKCFVTNKIWTKIFCFFPSRFFYLDCCDDEFFVRKIYHFFLDHTPANYFKLFSSSHWFMIHWKNLFFLFYWSLFKILC